MPFFKILLEYHSFPEVWKQVRGSVNHITKIRWFKHFFFGGGGGGELIRGTLRYILIDTSMSLKLIDHFKIIKKPLMWWTTHPAAYTRCCTGSQVPCYYFSLIGTIRACFLNHKEHTAEKKMVDFALPSSPSLIFTTQSCRLMSPFVSHKFPVIVLQLHHKRSI